MLSLGLCGEMRPEKDERSIESIDAYKNIEVDPLRTARSLDGRLRLACGEKLTPVEFHRT